MEMTTKLFGFRYLHGKLLIFKAVEGNPGGIKIDSTPSWAVDIREIIAMCFAGIGGVAFILVGEYRSAETIFIGMMLYATGRTIPGGSVKRQKKNE